MSNIEVILKLGAFAIILNEENEVLLSHRRDMDLWNLPGGGIEDSETPWDAVIREVKEETCLNVRISKLQGIYSNPKMNKTVFSFICEIISGEISTTNEADIHRFFNIDDIPENTSPNQVDRIKDYFLDRNKVYMKQDTQISSRELLRQLEKR